MSIGITIKTALSGIEVFLAILACFGAIFWAGEVARQFVVSGRSTVFSD